MTIFVSILTSDDVRVNKYFNRYVIVFLAFLIINLGIYRSLLEPGLTLAGDFTHSEIFSDYIEAYLFPLWSERTQTSAILSASKLALFAPAIALSSLFDLSTRGVYLAYYMVLGSLGGVFIFRLAEYIMQRENLKIRYEFVLAAALFFLFGTALAERAVTHPSVAFGVYLSPIILYTIIRGVEEDKIRYLLLSSLVFSFAAAAIGWFVYSTLVFLSYILYDMVYRMIVQRYFSFTVLKRAIKYSAIVIAPGILLTSYWLIPGAISGGTDLNPNTFLKQGVFQFYRYADIQNVMVGKGSFVSPIIYPNNSQFPYANELLGILTIIGLSSIIFRNKILIFLAVIYAAVVILTIIPHYFPDLYNWFVFDMPLSSIYSWAFRGPKLMEFVSLTLAPMIAYSGIKFYQTINSFINRHQSDTTIRKRASTNIIPSIFLIFVFLLSAVPNYVLLTGDFNGYHKVYSLPLGYKDLISYLEQQDSDYKSIWGPSFSGLSSTWSQGRIGRIEPHISPVDIFPNYGAANNFVDHLVFGIRFPYGSMTLFNSTSNVDELLAPLNIKYVVVHDDIPQLSDKTKKILQVLDNSEGLNSIKFEPITLYEVENPVSHISIKNQTMIIQGGGLSRYESALHIGGIESRNTNVFLSDVIGPPDNLMMFGASDIVLAENEVAYAEYMLDKNNVIVIYPYEYVHDYAPNTLWSKNSAKDVPFLNLFNAGSGHSFQSDYAKGIIFTRANSAETNIPLSVDGSREYRLIVRYLANDKGGIIEFSAGEQSLRLDSNQNLNRFVWGDLGVLTISPRTSTLSIESKGGFNAINALAFVPVEHYEEYKNEFIQLIQDKEIIYVFEGETDFSRTENTQVISDIGHSNGEAISLDPAGRLEGSFEILISGLYSLSAHGNGIFEVSVDNNRDIFAIEAGENEAMLKLDQGFHTIEFSGAVNSLERPYLDYVILKSNNGVDPKSSSTQLVSYRKIDLTTYEANVRTMTPYILAFAEAYDKGWIAEVKTSQGIISYEPVPLYGAINGFIIDAQGEYLVTIRFVPQTIFNNTLVISVIAYAGISTFLIYPSLKRYVSRSSAPN